MDVFCHKIGDFLLDAFDAKLALAVVSYIQCMNVHALDCLHHSFFCVELQ